MLDKQKIYIFIKNNGIIIDNDIFNYGFYVFTTYLGYLVVIIPVSLILGVLKETFAFLFFFIPLRKYIGGYHMKNSKACYICSVILGITIPILSKNIKCGVFLTISIYLICSFMTKKYGIIDHPNKRISIIEKKEYLKKALNLEKTYFILALIFLFTSHTYITNNVNCIFIFFIIGMLFKQIENNDKELK